MKKLFPALVFIALLSSPSWAADKNSKKEIVERKECLSTREYITTLKYLEERKEFQLNRDSAMLIADEVSQSCTGGAERFIRVMNLLLKAEIDSKTSLGSAKKLALAGKDSTDAFVEIFKSSFLEKMLDRDAQASFKIAMDFAQDFKGDLKLASQNFFAVAAYCSEEGKIELTKERCAQTAQKVAKLTAKFDRDLSKPFFKLVEFMMNSSEANLPLFQALEKSEKAIEAGPIATENFIEAYHFAVKKEGLALPIGEAISFAEKMASRSARD